jgi:hypothetical protein
VERVLTLEVEMVDRKTRLTPNKHRDPWESVKERKKKAAAYSLESYKSSTHNACYIAPVEAKTRGQAPAGVILKHMENKRMIAMNNVEKKMEQIVRVWFRFEDS